MEEKSLSQKESLELIAQMIGESKRNLEKGGGNIFLLWGYLGLIVSVGIWALLHFTGNYAAQWLWFVMPIVGYPAMYMMFKRSDKRAVTFIGSVISKVWIVIGIVAAIISLVVAYDYKLLPILFVMSLIVTMGVAISGLVLKFKPVVVAGFAGVILSFVLLFVDWQSQILVFGAMSVVMLVIPGHIMNSAGKKAGIAENKPSRHV